MTDPLAQFWVHEIKVRRYVQNGSWGETFDPPADQPADAFMAWVQDGKKLIADGTGGQIASSARVACPLSVAYIPIDSEITLPDKFAAPGQTRVTKVIAVARADAGDPFPNHMTISLL